MLSFPCFLKTLLPKLVELKINVPELVCDPDSCNCCYRFFFLWAEKWPPLCTLSNDFGYSARQRSINKMGHWLILPFEGWHLINAPFIEIADQSELSYLLFRHYWCLDILVSVKWENMYGKIWIVIPISNLKGMFVGCLEERGSYSTQKWVCR